MAPQDGVEMPPAGLEVVDAIENAIFDYCPDAKVDPIERFAFYDEAKTCFAVIQTLERRPYGNVILKKGCVGGDGKDLKP
jgi:L-fucose mutarotase